MQTSWASASNCVQYNVRGSDATYVGRVQDPDSPPGPRTAMVMSVLLCDAMLSIEMQNAEATP